MIITRQHLHKHFGATGVTKFPYHYYFFLYEKQINQHTNVSCIICVARIYIIHNNKKTSFVHSQESQHYSSYKII